MFPMTITLNTPAQLNAVLLALRPDLEAQDFRDPEVGAAYVEAKERVAAVPISDEINPQFAAAVKAARKAEAEAAAGKSTPATSGKGAPAADTKPTAEADKADAPETKAGSSAAEATTYDQVKKAILDVSKTKGREAAIALLGKFGAAKGPDLQEKPETFGPFVRAAAELLS